MPDERNPVAQESTAAEQAMAQLWQEVFELDDAVSPDAHFMDLGGNSLVAIMLASRLEETFGVRPSMDELFSSTVRRLAAACEAHRATTGAAGSRAAAGSSA
jgi:acyl carrier protein